MKKNNTQVIHHVGFTRSTRTCALRAHAHTHCSSLPINFFSHLGWLHLLCFTMGRPEPPSLLVFGYYFWNPNLRFMSGYDIAYTWLIYILFPLLCCHSFNVLHYLLISIIKGNYLDECPLKFASILGASPL